ncbi:MAG TPA: hypothetical protein VKY74_26315, partial [Chloroflexia bacterium]|nr:hypothetical protein [Chloroflexia bacterium]
RLVLPGADVVPVERLADLDAPQPAEIERKRALVSAARSRQQPTAGSRLLGDGVSPGAGLTLYVVNREKAKLGPGQRLAYHTHRPRDPQAIALRTCPRCGSPVEADPGEILRKRLTCLARPVAAHQYWGGLATQLARLLLPAYPQDDTILALVPARVLRVQLFGEQFDEEDDKGDAEKTLPAEEENPGGAADAQDGAPAAAVDDLPDEQRQERWAAWAVTPAAGGRTRLDTLWPQVQAAIAAALVPSAIRPALPGLIAALFQVLPLVPPETRWWWVRLIARAARIYSAPERKAESPLPALLRGWLLLHLALPLDQQPPRIARSTFALARYGAALPANDPARKAVQEALGRLLLFLLPNAPTLLDRLVPAVQRVLDQEGAPLNDTVWTAFTRARARLLAELGDAARQAADPQLRSTLYEAQRQRLVRGADWPDLEIDLATSQLTWRSTAGNSTPAASVVAAYAALGALLPLGDFRRARHPCGEALYQVVPTPRRWPLARYIARKRRRLFDLVVLDEMHEYNTVGSAQEQAAHLLLKLGVPAIGLTGSLSGGYASSVFANLWAFSARFRAQFGYHDKGKFVRRYGYLKVLKVLPERGLGPQLREYGKASMRAEYSEDPLIRELGESPGFLPALIVDHLLGMTAIILKEDLGIALPPVVEQPAALVVAQDNAVGQKLLANYRHLESRLLEQIGRDRWDKDLRGRLLGALAELPGFLDLATDDVGNAVGKDGRPRYEVRYATGCVAGGQLVASGELIPAGELLPKECWLLEQLEAQLKRDRNVVLFVRHTGNARFIARLQRLIREHLRITPALLDASKVPPHNREDWIRQAAIAMHRRVLLTNAEAVKTGLNCLTPYFKTAIWYELTYNALTYRQANGRVHRIGSDPAHPIEILVPVYARTAQEIALDLQARKLTASLQLDAGSVESALQAAGASGKGAEDAAIQQLAMSSLGQAIFAILSGEDRLENEFAEVPVHVAPALAPPVLPPAAAAAREYIVAGPQLSLFGDLDSVAPPRAANSRRPAQSPTSGRGRAPKQGSLFG